ncbi:hypothetical protein D3C80_1539930 [compost metagenome]
MAVIDVQRRPGDEGQLALAEELHRAHIVGFHQQFAVVAQALETGQLGGRLNQRQAGYHQFGRGAAAQVAGQPQPLVETEGATLGAHGFAQVDDIQRLLEHLGVKVQQFFPCPVEQYRT